MQYNKLRPAWKNMQDECAITHNAYSWDDLRFLLAVARTGTLSGAARRLGVNHTTVSRRIRALEERVGVRLFERLSSGWATTEAGEDMLASARRVEEEMAALDRRVLGQDARLSGTVRVAITDMMALALMPDFATFSETHGGRWNPPKSFPALYLNEDATTARINLRLFIKG